MYVAMYLGAIVGANWSVATFGQPMFIANSFFLIGIDLTARDVLHERWGEHLKRNMLILILAGSAMSALLSASVAQIALASFVAFSATGFADTVVYEMLHKRGRQVRRNGSNVVSALVDTVVFSALAFGFPLNVPAVAASYLAKVGGGLFWSVTFSVVGKRNA